MDVRDIIYKLILLYLFFFFFNITFIISIFPYLIYKA